MQTPKKKLFKDWFDAEAAEMLATQIHTAYPAFNRKNFQRSASLNLEKLEMKARVTQFSEALATCLPADKETALQILTRSLPPCLPGEENVTDGWLQWPIGTFIADYGLPHFDTAMQAMIELTQRFSSEFAVRPFIEHLQSETLAQLLALTEHPSPHVRRWCSEGSRPLLPWGKKLTKLVVDPTPVWPILEALKDDPSPYVRKSVANHLNDIAKNHPDLVVDRCRIWMRDAGPERKRIIKHALRTLIKNGHPEALSLLGYKPGKNLKIRLRISPREICMGEKVNLHFSVMNSHQGQQKLLIDYAVTYIRQKGHTGRKVFKWTTLDLAPGKEAVLSKKHPMKQTSIRALYPGEHRLEVLVNGQSLADGTFILKM